MTRNKSIGKKPAPKVPQIRGSGTLRFNSAEHRERYQVYMQKPVVPPYVIKLDTLEEFGIREEVEAFLGEKEWKYLLVDFEDEIYPDLVLEFSPDDLSRYLEIDAMQVLTFLEASQVDSVRSLSLHLWSSKLHWRGSNSRHAVSLWDGTKGEHSSRLGIRIPLPEAKLP
nr:hypothetical protein Itr_chr02CG13040 [Ipomoea trifida]